MDSLDYICVANSMGLYTVSLRQLALKAAVFCEISRNNGHRVVQGHSRSPILVPIESPLYATSYEYPIYRMHLALFPS